LDVVRWCWRSRAFADLFCRQSVTQCRQRISLWENCSALRDEVNAGCLIHRLASLSIAHIPHSNAVGFVERGTRALQLGSQGIEARIEQSTAARADDGQAAANWRDGAGGI
jgi:hypothetical protein